MVLWYSVAGVAQTHIDRRLARHKLTSTVVLPGRQAWHLWYYVILGGRRGTNSHRPSFGAAQTHIYRRFAWQAWHKLTNSHRPSFGVVGVALMALGGALGPGLVARDAAALCVAGVALGDIHLRFTWQASHKLTSTVVWHGRRGTYGIGWRAWAQFSRA